MEVRMKVFLPLLLAASLWAADYKSDTAGAPPAESGAFAASLSKQGVKVLNADGSVYCQMWFVSTLPTGPATGEANASLTNVPLGSFLGVLQFPAKGADRRGQPIEPGVYTMRFSLFPVNGDHQGVAPQRDFLVLSPISVDTNPKVVEGFEPLMDLSRKASRSPHPAVLSFWKADSDFKPGLHKEGEQDWVLHTKIGDTPVAIIVIGKTEG